MSAMPSVGSPTEVNTMASMISPTDGIPAVPMDAIIAVAITVRSWAGVSSMPYTCAMKITATPCIIEVPSILIVAPSGIVKDEIFLETPIFLSSVSMESGMVALDVAVVNANIITGENLFKKRSGLSRVKTNSSS